MSLVKEKYIIEKNVAAPFTILDRTGEEYLYIYIDEIKHTKYSVESYPDEIKKVLRSVSSIVSENISMKEDIFALRENLKNVLAKEYVQRKFNEIEKRFNEFDDCIDQMLSSIRKESNNILALKNIVFVVAENRIATGVPKKAFHDDMAI